MHDRHPGAPTAQGGLELKHATGVAGGDDVRLQWRNETSLTVPEVVRRARLDEIVDARRPAADVALRYLGQLQLRDARQQRAWLSSDALRVLQVAGVVIGDAQRQGVPLGARS